MPEGRRTDLIHTLEHTAAFMTSIGRDFRENKFFHKDCIEKIDSHFRHVLDISAKSGDFDLMVDHRIRNLRDFLSDIGSAVQERIQNQIHFSNQAVMEINHLFEGFPPFIESSLGFLRTDRLSFLKAIEKGLGEYKKYCNDCASDHNRRLTLGICMPAASVVYLDIIHAFSGIYTEITSLIRLVSGLHERDCWSRDARSLLWANN